MRILFREYGSFIISFIVTVMFFYLFFSTTFTVASLSTSVQGISDALMIEADKGTDISYDFIDKSDSSKGVSFSVDQSLTTNNMYDWNDIIVPKDDKAYSFSLIDIRYQETGERVYTGMRNGLVSIQESNDGLDFYFKKDGLYIMRFRLREQGTSNEEMGSVSIYIRKSRD